MTATGTGPLTYSWLKNGNPISGAPNAASYTITGVTVADAGSYSVGITGACSPGTSSIPATLTVNTAPAITGQPANVTECPSQQIQIAVTATGTALTYQWQENDGSGWTNLANSSTYGGVQTPTLGIITQPGLTGHQYRCVVSGTCPSPVESDAATLTVNMPPQITSQPQGATLCAGADITFSVTATGTGPFTYSWKKMAVRSPEQITPRPIRFPG